MPEFNKPLLLCNIYIYMTVWCRCAFYVGHNFRLWKKEEPKLMRAVQRKPHSWPVRVSTFHMITPSL